MKCPQDKGHAALFAHGDTHYCAGCGRFTRQQGNARHSFWIRWMCTPASHFSKKLIKGHEMRMSEGVRFCTKCGRCGKDLCQQCDGANTEPEARDPGQRDPAHEPECGHCLGEANADCELDSSGGVCFHEGPMEDPTVGLGPDEGQLHVHDGAPEQVADKKEEKLS